VADVATFAFGARSFVPAYGFGSALAGQDAGIRRDVATGAAVGYSSVGSTIAGGA